MKNKAEKAQKTRFDGKNSLVIFKKLMRFIGRYKLILALSVLLAAVSVILQLYVPILFGAAIDEIIAAHRVDFGSMWGYLWQIIAVVAASALASWVMSLLNNRMTYRIVQDLRAQAIRHIQVLPLSYLDRHSTGDIVSRVIADTGILSDGLLLGFTQLFSGVVTIAATLVFMFSKNVWITLMVILLTPVSFLVAKFIASRSYHMFRRQSETRGRQTALIEEMIGSQKVVRAFGYEKKASARFAEVNEELRQCSQQAVFYSSLTNPSTRFVNNVIYAGVALVGALMIPGGALTVGGLSVLLSYANQYMKPFNDISSAECARLRRADLRAARGAAGKPGCGRRRRRCAGRGRHPERRLQLRQEPPAHRAVQPARGAGHARRDRRADRLRQDDVHQPSDALLRRGRRQHRCGREAD